MRAAANFIVIAILGMSPSCSRRPTAPLRYTEAEVQKFVLPGTTREAIIKRFGDPVYVEKNPKYEDGVVREDEILYFHTETPPEAVNGK